MYILREYLNDYYGNKVSGSYIIDIGRTNKSKLYRMFIFGRLYNSVMSMNSPRSLIDHDRSIVSFDKLSDPLKTVLSGIEEKMNEFKELFYDSKRHHHLENEFELFLNTDNEEEIQKIIQNIKQNLDILLVSISQISSSIILK